MKALLNRDTVTCGCLKYIMVGVSQGSEVGFSTFPSLFVSDVGRIWFGLLCDR